MTPAEIKSLREYCMYEPKTRQQIMWALQYQKSDNTMKRLLKKMVESDILETVNNYYYRSK